MNRKKCLLAVSCGTVIGATIATITRRTRRFERHLTGEVGELYASSPAEQSIVTVEMLEGLPEPVQRYLDYTGVVGKPMVSTVKLQQQGRMNFGSHMPWLPLKATQHYTVGTPGFIWDGTVLLGPIPVVRGRDRYFEGTGNMLIRACSLLKVMDAAGPEMDQGAMMRYLSEMIWFPAAFLRENITFEPLDDNAARVTLTDHGRSVSATLAFDDVGRVTNLTARRYRSVGNGFELADWETPVVEYGVFEGLKLPVRGKAVWKLPEGDLTYIDIVVTDVRYNHQNQ